MCRLTRHCVHLVSRLVRLSYRHSIPLPRVLDSLSSLCIYISVRISTESSRDNEIPLRVPNSRGKRHEFSLPLSRSPIALKSSTRRDSFIRRVIGWRTTTIAQERNKRDCWEFGEISVAQCKWVEDRKEGKQREKEGERQRERFFGHLPRCLEVLPLLEFGLNRRLERPPAALASLKSRLFVIKWMNGLYQS